MHRKLLSASICKLPLLQITDLELKHDCMHTFHSLCKINYRNLMIAVYILITITYVALVCGSPLGSCDLDLPCFHDNKSVVCKYGYCSSNYNYPKIYMP